MNPDIPFVIQQLPTEVVLPNLPSMWELCGRILLAALLGGIIGLERELRGQPSGLRTHIAVAIGAALFGVVSAYAFTEFIALRADNNYQVDVTRVASQVVVGVGFLGGGAIIKQGVNVRGLTSAAGLWVSSAIGLAMGLGMYIEAAVATVALVGALWLLKKPSRWLRHRGGRLRNRIIVVMPVGSVPTEVITLVSDLPDTIIRSIEVETRDDDDTVVIEIGIQGRMEVFRGAVAALSLRSDVISAELE